MKATLSVIATYWRNCALVLLSAIVIALIWRQGVLFQMDKKHFSIRFVQTCIPIAISDLVHGHKRDYTGYYRVKEVFIKDSASSLNKLIRKAIHLTDTQGPPQTHCADDIGVVDYT